jgi:hypothetical protein
MNNGSAKKRSKEQQQKEDYSKEKGKCQKRRQKRITVSTSGVETEEKQGQEGYFSKALLAVIRTGKSIVKKNSCD